ncbi:MAG: hypothetical protein JW867_00590 [Candidatus Omnitrophica bacterium]|nr:hypothetical protein [Candidatus Omnitrophota bacterium]
MKKFPSLTAFIILFYFFETALFAGGKFFNGNDWNKFLPVMKISYISGLYDGTAFCESGFLSSQDVEASPMFRRFPMDMTFKEVVNSLDIFYSDEKNYSIPIIYALHIVKMEHEGLDNQKINSYKKEIQTRVKE